MGYFYFDESIHEDYGFVLGAVVYSQHDYSDLVAAELKQAGLKPKIDEFKSGRLKAGDQNQISLRARLARLIQNKYKVGMVIAPISQIGLLGDYAIEGLRKIISKNRLSSQIHQVYFDEEISINCEENKKVENCTIYLKQDSKIILSIQLADLVAHYLSTMLKERLSQSPKKGSPISNPRVNRQISAYAHAGVACTKLFIFHFTSFKYFVTQSGFQF